MGEFLYHPVPDTRKIRRRLEKLPKNIINSDLSSLTKLVWIITCCQNVLFSKYTYIYIYIFKLLERNVGMCIHIYIYIYIQILGFSRLISNVQAWSVWAAVIHMSIWLGQEIDRLILWRPRGVTRNDPKGFFRDSVGWQDSEQSRTSTSPTKVTFQDILPECSALEERTQ